MMNSLQQRVSAGRWLLLAAASLSLAACSGGGDGGDDSPQPADTTAPALGSNDPVSPGDGAMDVPLATTIQATFNEALDPASVTATSFTVTSMGGGPGAGVSGSYSVSGATATFTPATNLAPDTGYVVVLLGSIRDQAGNAWGEDFSWTFTTESDPGGGDVEPPTVAATSPIDGALDVPADSPIFVEFSEAIDPASVGTTTLQVFGPTPIGDPPSDDLVAGSVTVSDSFVAFVPDAPLALSSIYRVRVAAPLTDLAGNEFMGPFEWSFTTMIEQGDVEPPTVLASVPAPGSSDVEVETPIEITFSEPMLLDSLETALSLVDGSGPLERTLSLSGDVLTIEADAGLEVNHSYTVSVTTAATDLAGNALEAEHRYTFTIVPVREGYWYQISNGAFGEDLLLTSDSGNPAVGASRAIGLEPARSRPTQYFRFEDNGAGTWTIRTEHQGDRWGLSAQLFPIEVTFSADTAGPEQQWLVIRESDEEVRLRTLAVTVQRSMSATLVFGGYEITMEPFS
ncbi:MAG: Ig-like domain-containing protein, partial [Planctomycetota bacterium]